MQVRSGGNSLSDPRNDGGVHVARASNLSPAAPARQRHAGRKLHTASHLTGPGRVLLQSMKRVIPGQQGTQR